MIKTKTGNDIALRIRQIIRFYQVEAVKVYFPVTLQKIETCDAFLEPINANFSFF